MSDNENQPNGSESGEEKKPQPVGLFSPQLKHLRKGILMRWILTTVTLMAFIMAILSVYWACLFKVEEHLSNLVFYVVDMDAGVAPYNTSGITPIVGPIITDLARTQVASGSPTLGWGPLFAKDFDYDPIAVRQAVYDFKAWGAIIINPNATALLIEAVQTGNTSYDPMGACQLVYIDSRDDTNWYDFINPLVRAFIVEATAAVGKEWAGMVLEDAQSNTTLLANIAAVRFTTESLEPRLPDNADSL